MVSTPFDPRFINGGVAVPRGSMWCKRRDIQDLSHLLPGKIRGGGVRRCGWLGVVRSGDAIGPADGLSTSRSDPERHIHPNTLPWTVYGGGLRPAGVLVPTKPGMASRLNSPAASPAES